MNEQPKWCAIKRKLSCNEELSAASFRVLALVERRVRRTISFDERLTFESPSPRTSSL
ncbi:MAG: hypothetical protein ACTS6G_03730 [Candidatus Hodgkinia cicadicola]